MATALLPDSLSAMEEESKELLKAAGGLISLKAKKELTSDELRKPFVLFVRNGLLLEAMNKSAPVMGILKPGEVLPQTLVDSPGLDPIRVEAAIDSILILLPRDLLMAELRRKPGQLESLFREVVCFSRRLRVELASRAVESLDLRILRLLWILGTTAEDGSRISPAIPLVTLARCLGATREEVTRKIKSMYTAGLIEEGDGCLHLPASAAFELENPMIPSYF